MRLLRQREDSCTKIVKCYHSFKHDSSFWLAMTGEDYRFLVRSDGWIPALLLGDDGWFSNVIARGSCYWSKMTNCVLLSHCIVILHPEAILSVNNASKVILLPKTRLLRQKKDNCTKMVKCYHYLENDSGFWLAMTGEDYRFLVRSDVGKPASWCRVNDYHSLRIFEYKSSQVGLNEFISSSFRFRFPALICFSLAIASTIEW